MLSITQLHEIGLYNHIGHDGMRGIPILAKKQTLSRFLCGEGAVLQDPLVQQGFQSLKEQIAIGSSFRMLGMAEEAILTMLEFQARKRFSNAIGIA